MSKNDSRVEKILKTIITGADDSDLEPPQSRVEWLLMALSDAIGKMDDINLFHICEQGEYDPILLTPTIQNPEQNLFYLVPSSVGNDKYSEWIYTSNGEWEKFGNVEDIVIDESLSISGAAADAAKVGEIKSQLNDKQDTLTFDNTPTENSSNPVTSDGVYDALSNKQDTLTFDNTPTENSNNPVTSDGVYDALSNKQDTLTFDNTPTENSSNPVTSDGIYNALFNNRVIVSGTTPTINAVSGNRYICGEVASISIIPPQTGIINVIFESGTTPSILALPQTVTMPEWFDSTDLEANRIYEISIADGIYGVVTSWPA